MAKAGGRKYVRDKNGRFASVGATARGNRLTGKKGNQGRRGGNLDGGDVGKKSSVVSGTIGRSKGARDRNRADRRGVSVSKAQVMGSAQRAANTRAKNKAAAAAPQAAAKPARTAPNKPNKAKENYKAQRSIARESARMASKTKGDGTGKFWAKDAKKEQAKLKSMEKKRKSSRARVAK